MVSFIAKDKYVIKDEWVQVAKFGLDMIMFFRNVRHKIHPKIIRDIISEYNEISAEIKNS